MSASIHWQGSGDGDTHRDVLVVDDYPAVLRLLKLTLRGGGFDVSGASNGAEALEEVEGRQPAAIALDIEMPVMNGFEFLRSAASAARGLPVVILSAYNPRRVQRELGAQGYLCKPFEPEDLIDIVSRVV